jgi:hypothetical protein
VKPVAVKRTTTGTGRGRPAGHTAGCTFVKIFGVPKRRNSLQT